MTGERFEWHRVASHLRLRVPDARNLLTYSEFIDWVAYFAVEEERETKQDLYLAQIAAEVRRGQVKSPNLVKARDFLFTFGKQERSIEGSKHIWAAHLKVDVKKK